MPAASLAKLPWTLAAIRAHHDGALDLTTPLPAQSIADSRYRDGLAALTPHAPLPWASLIGLGLVTSANPVFDHLTRTPGLRERAHSTSGGVTLTSGFSDEDLDGPIYGNTMTAASSAVTLLGVLREARDDLQPISWGLINSARTTRLVRDLDSAPKRGDGFYSANKTGTLTRIRNDVAALIDGEHVLVIAALTCHQPTTHDVDHAMAGLGAQLADARYGNKSRADAT